MPRRARVVKREVVPDPRFGSRTLTRFINKVMLSGKKAAAEKIVYGALDIVEGQLHRNPLDVFELAMRWLIASARARGGRSMAEKLAAELRDASQGQGATVKKKDDVHRMAEANKAFAHYRW